jgi:transposase
MLLARYEVFLMIKQQGGRGTKYSDEFKRRTVAESRADGVSVSAVAKKHGVSTKSINAWRSDGRFQPDGSSPTAFMSVDILDGDEVAVPSEAKLTRPCRIEITLENGRKLSVSEGVAAGFVLELARGLIA